MGNKSIQSSEINNKIMGLNWVEINDSLKSEE